MTKQQIIILAALACAALCVLAGGAYVVISEERTWQRENATAMALAIEVPTISEIPAPTNTPILKPTPTNTPTPFLFSDNPKLYLPSESDMPQGWQLQPESSGPMWGGYHILYENRDNLWNAKTFGLDFFIVLSPSEEQAQSIFRRWTSEGEFVNALAELGEMESTYISVPNVDESAAFRGSMSSDRSGPFPIDQSAIIFRVKNAVAWVQVMSPIDNPRGLQEALYYVSLITEKLSE